MREDDKELVFYNIVSHVRLREPFLALHGRKVSHLALPLQDRFREALLQAPCVGTHASVQEWYEHVSGTADFFFMYCWQPLAQLMTVGNFTVCPMLRSPDVKKSGADVYTCDVPPARATRHSVSKLS